MKQNILPAIRLTLARMLFFCILYPLLIFSFAQAAPNKGAGETVVLNHRTAGYRLEGQQFTDDRYFQGRPSAVAYHATASGGSNKGTSNPDYLKQVQEKIDSFLAHNPGVRKEDIPSDLVTASASGLDPDISVQAARVQVERIAKRRNIAARLLNTLVEEHIQKPFAGFLGTARINVLQLNLDLDGLKNK